MVVSEHLARLVIWSSPGLPSAYCKQGKTSQEGKCKKLALGNAGFSEYKSCFKLWQESMSNHLNLQSNCVMSENVLLFSFPLLTYSLHVHLIFNLKLVSSFSIMLLWHSQIMLMLKYHCSNDYSSGTSILFFRTSKCYVPVQQQTKVWWFRSGKQ